MGFAQLLCIYCLLASASAAKQCRRGESCSIDKDIVGLLQGSVLIKDSEQNGQSTRGLSPWSVRVAQQNEENMETSNPDEKKVAKPHQGDEDAIWGSQEQSGKLLQVNANTSGITNCFNHFVSDLGKCGGDMVVSAAKCGVTAITDATKCGTQTITSIAKCGSSVTKICGLFLEDGDRETKHDMEEKDDIDSAEGDDSPTEREVSTVETADIADAEHELAGRRRRRFIGGRRRRRLTIPVPPIPCSFKDVAKSCSVPKTCDIANECEVPKSCDIKVSFSECFSSLESTLESSSQTYANMVTDTGCTSLDGCETKVKEGLTSVWSLIETEAREQAGKTADGLLGKLDSVNPAGIINSVKGNVGEVAGQTASISSQIASYMGGANKFKKWDFNNFCTGDGEGFWYMVPTDCGLFDAMRALFNGGVLQAPQNFKKAGDALKECTGLTGLFDIPTPFMKLSVKKYCLPDFMVEPFEYMMGGIIYAQQSSASAVSSLTKVISAKLCLLLKKAGITLQKLGTLIQEGTQEQEESGNGGESISKKERVGLDDWHVSMSLQMDISLTDPAGVSFGVSFGFKITAGMVNGAAAIPNLSMFLKFDSSIKAIPSVPPGPPLSTGVTVLVGFAPTAAKWTNRGAASASFCVTPKVNLKAISIPVTVGLPICFGVLPEVSVPKSLVVALSADAELVQMGEEAKTKVADASRLAYERGEDSITAGIHTAMHHLANDPRLDEAIVSAKVDTKQIVQNAVAAHVNRARVVKEAMDYKTAVEKANLEGSTPPDTSQLNKAMPSFEEKSSKDEPADENSPLNLEVSAMVALDMCITPDFGDISNGGVSPCNGASISEMTSQLQKDYGDTISNGVGCIADFIR